MEECRKLKSDLKKEEREKRTSTGEEDESGHWTTVIYLFSITVNTLQTHNQTDTQTDEFLPPVLLLKKNISTSNQEGFLVAALLQKKKEEFYLISGQFYIKDWAETQSVYFME